MSKREEIETVGVGAVCVAAIWLAVAGRWLLAVATLFGSLVAWGLISVAFDLRYFGALVDDEDDPN